MRCTPTREASPARRFRSSISVCTPTIRQSRQKCLFSLLLLSTSCLGRPTPLCAVVSNVDISDGRPKPRFQTRRAGSKPGWFRRKLPRASSLEGNRFQLSLFLSLLLCWMVPGRFQTRCSDTATFQVNCSLSCLNTHCADRSSRKNTARCLLAGPRVRTGRAVWRWALPEQRVSDARLVDFFDSSLTSSVVYVQSSSAARFSTFKQGKEKDKKILFNPAQISRVGAKSWIFLATVDVSHHQLERIRHVRTGDQTYGTALDWPARVAFIDAAGWG